MYRLELEIPGLPKRTNQFQSMGWQARMKEAQNWKCIIILNVGYRLPPKPLTKAKLTLIRISSQSPDFDGLVSSFKHVIDGLIKAGVIVNDKFENIGQPDYRWEKGKQGEGRIKVIVEEICDQPLENGKEE